MSKTAMQQAIDEYNLSNPKINFSHWFKDNKEKLLELEKQQMIKFGKEIYENRLWSEVQFEKHFISKYGIKTELSVCEHKNKTWTINQADQRVQKCKDCGKHQ